MDTDLLIGIVSSLLDSKLDADIILDALVQCNGDAQKAAARLNSGADTTPQVCDVGGGRKRRRGLQEWLEQGTSNKTSKSEEQGSSHNVNRGSSGPSVVRKPPSHSSKHPETVNLMNILHQPPPSKKKIPEQKPPLLLSNPTMIAKYTPCTLHLSVLPPELASKLFYTMQDASRSWKRNKWWLFDRVVESPHRTSFYARKTDGIADDSSWQQAAQFWYNGRPTDAPEVFPSPMEEACEIIEKIVNNELQKRPRLPLEWAGDGDPSGLLWRANVAASNCYEGRNESVGWHSDQMTYLGPMCTIASLSLGTRRIFSLREVIPSQEVESRRAQTFNIPLPHNSLIIMHASCQEKFKHSVPPQSSMDLFRPAHPSEPGSPIETSNCRINITFRFYRPDFRPPSIPRCKCDVPMILRPDMKHRSDDRIDKYWWSCYSGVQNEGNGCNMWKVMDMDAEGRGSSYRSTIKSC